MVTDWKICQLLYKALRKLLLDVGGCFYKDIVLPLCGRYYFIITFSFLHPVNNKLFLLGLIQIIYVHKHYQKSISHFLTIGKTNNLQVLFYQWMCISPS